MIFKVRMTKKDGKKFSYAIEAASLDNAILKAKKKLKPRKYVEIRVKWVYGTEFAVFKANGQIWQTSEFHRFLGKEK